MAIDYTKLMDCIKTLKDRFIIVESSENYITVEGSEEFKYIMESIKQLAVENDGLKKELKFLRKSLTRQFNDYIQHLYHFNGQSELIELERLLRGHIHDN